MRVLICDDHVVFGEALAAYLSCQVGFDDVQVVSSGRAALRQARLHDVLVLDLYLSAEESGLDVIEAVVATCPGLSVVVLTGSPDADAAAAALALGARGFLTKDCIKGRSLSPRCSGERSHAPWPVADAPEGTSTRSWPCSHHVSGKCCVCSARE